MKEQLSKLKIRSSALGNIMAGRIGLTEKQREELTKLQGKEKLTKLQEVKLKELEEKNQNKELPQGAKTYIRELVNQLVYGYTDEISTPQMEKGVLFEDESIDLYNVVNFSCYKKNEGSEFNEYITGTCDIIGTSEIIDIKTSWSKKTFPKLSEDIDSSLYEWQGRAYMWLYDRPKFVLTYCLVTTPEHLRQWENPELHEVDHIPEHLRVTTKEFTRDPEKELQIIERVKMCRVYALQYYEKLMSK